RRKSWRSPPRPPLGEYRPGGRTKEAIMNRTLLSTVLLAGSASSVLGQCTPEWLTPPTGALSSFDVSGSSVLASATWFPSSPATVQLAIGGNFSAVGGVVFNNVATWDGTRWLSM